MAGSFFNQTDIAEIKSFQHFMCKYLRVALVFAMIGFFVGIIVYPLLLNGGGSGDNFGDQLESVSIAIMIYTAFYSNWGRAFEVFGPTVAGFFVASTTHAAVGFVIGERV